MTYQSSPFEAIDLEVKAFMVAIRRAPFEEFMVHPAEIERHMAEEIAYTARMFLDQDGPRDGDWAMKTDSVTAIGFDYFTGGKEGPERILSDVIRRARRDHEKGRCLHCGQVIRKGMVYESMFAIWDGPVEFKWCAGCLFALYVEEWDGCALSMARDGLHR